MRWQNGLFLGLVLGLAGAGCQSGVDAEAEKIALLTVHLADIEAHRAGDVSALLATIPEEILTVSDGEVIHQTHEEIRTFFTDYLAGTEYSRYEDLNVPHAEVSADGTLGWVISRMAVERNEPDGQGGRRTRAFTYAGIMTYAKREGRWVKTANVSTFAP